MRNRSGTVEPCLARIGSRPGHTLVRNSENPASTGIAASPVRAWLIGYGPSDLGQTRTRSSPGQSSTRNFPGQRLAVGQARTYSRPEVDQGLPRLGLARIHSNLSQSSTRDSDFGQARSCIGPGQSSVRGSQTSASTGIVAGPVITRSGTCKPRPGQNLQYARSAIGQDMTRNRPGQSLLLLLLNLIRSFH